MISMVSNCSSDAGGDPPRLAGAEVPLDKPSGEPPDSPLVKLMPLRYAGTCSVCRVALPAKTRAYWHRDTHTVICMACHANPSQELSRPADPVPATELDRGSAGRSTQAEFERRHHKREERIGAKFGHLAGIVKFLSDDPQSTKAWASGTSARSALRRNWRTGSGPAPCSSATAGCQGRKGTSTTSPSRHQACG